MKPRIRAIKPEVALDEDLWDLAQETGLPVYQAFTMLWCCADREGRFEWRPRALKAHCLPYWDGDFSRVLDALATRGFIVRYVSQGREFGLVRTFKEHQHINGKEPPSGLPPPPPIVSIPQCSRVNDASSTGAEHVSDVSIPSLPFPSLPDPVPNTEQPVTSGSRAKPTSLAAALELPIVERAQLVERNLDDRAWIQLIEPHKWPEAKQVAESLAAAEGREHRALGQHHRDAGTRAVIGLLADVPVDEVLAALPRVVADEWWQRSRPGLCGLTVNQVRKAQGPPPKAAPRRAGITPIQPNHGNLKVEEYQ